MLFFVPFFSQANKSKSNEIKKINFFIVHKKRSIISITVEPITAQAQKNLVLVSLKVG